MLSVCIEKVISFHSTGIVLLYSEACHRSREGLKLFLERVLLPDQEKSQSENKRPSKFFVLFFLSKKSRGSIFDYPHGPPPIPSSASRG